LRSGAEIDTHFSLSPDFSGINEVGCILDRCVSRRAGPIGQARDFVGNLFMSPPRLAYVLDDDASIGAIVCKFLKVCGYEPLQFVEPLPFFKQTRVACPEIVVLDLALGQTDAVDVIRHLEVLRFQGSVLLVSGSDQSVLHEIEQVGLARGLAMLPPLQKPFRLGDLKASLKAAPEVGSKSAVETAPSRVRADLGEALRNDWIEVWYQPKVDLKTQKVCGAEALMRVRHPVYGLVLPVDVLPPSEDPLYQPLTRFVLRRTFADWDRFADHGLYLKFAINVPVSVLCISDFVGHVRTLIPSHPEFPGLIAEITEDEVIRDPGTVREVAAQLRIHKVSLSIDDFGTVHSTLSRLLELPCSEVKIDRQFVVNCGTDPRKLAMCRSIVDLAHSFGISACAEGVESMIDLVPLLEMNCDTAQGFLFAKPMRAELLLDMLLRMHPAEGMTAANRTSVA
jgi:EAL domain-containing protein (putative c-di-GMP-specific phosphodiesterase class I)/FixJ family two-component response regulator